MSLNHDFLLVSRSELDTRGYESFYHSSQAVLLHDDFISYIYDCLLWIPAADASDKTPLNVSKGFNRWGASLYEVEGARKLKKLFAAWARIFAEGPEPLNLTQRNCRERLILSRDDLVRDLKTIAKWADEVIASNGEKVILHLGI